MSETEATVYKRLAEATKQLADYEAFTASAEVRLKQCQDELKAEYQRIIRARNEVRSLIQEAGLA